MASNNSFLSFLLLILSSSLHLCLSQNSSGLDQLIPSLESVSVIQDAQCMKKLLPCQPFLKSQDKPPQTCCGPLNEMASNATDCLCSFFNNPKLLLSFNVSKDEILKLPNACGVDVDVSKCNSRGADSPPSGDADKILGELKQTSKDPPPSDSSSTKMITPYGITYFGVPRFVALLTALVFSAY